MRHTTLAITLAAAVAAVVAGLAGYGLGRGGLSPAFLPASSPASPPATGMAADATTAAAGAPAARKLLYYRNPMGLPDTSPTPKKDPMGMDYLPVYEGEEPQAAAGQVRISADKVQKLGVRTEAAALRPLGRVLRAAGRIEPDERRVFAVAPRFEGYVERLHASATGQAVGRGQVLFEAYSPELLAAQREYLVAAQGAQALRDAGPDAQAGMRQLADAALARLRNWELSPAQLDALVRGGQASRTLAFHSPVAGIVTEKKALQGMRFMPGETLYQVTDLSAVWVVADVAEQDIAALRQGAPARVKVDAYPGRTFEGRVAYVYPVLKAETRSVPVRVELANPGLLLKPAMFAQVELSVDAGEPVLAVPDSAVIDSGTRRIVLVQLAEGRFEPREVDLGARGAHYVQVTRGLRAGEPVVVSANFLLDAESNLKAALGAFGAAPPAGAASAPGSPPATSAPVPTPVPAPRAAHQADGTVEAVDTQAGTLTLAHGPVPSLKWPPMTMEFKAAHAGLLAGLKPGARLRFEFVERQPGDYVVTAILPADPHAGHR